MTFRPEYGWGDFLLKILVTILVFYFLLGWMIPLMLLAVGYLGASLITFVIWGLVIVAMFIIAGDD